MLKRASVGSVAEAYLELLAARGVEYFFANAGTDFAPIVEAYARRAAQGQALPRPITVPHETTAVALAHGYAMVTGRPQVVMVHVIVGTANALGGIMNAARANVPMLVTAGPPSPRRRPWRRRRGSSPRPGTRSSSPRLPAATRRPYGRSWRWPRRSACRSSTSGTPT